MGKLLIWVGLAVAILLVLRIAASAKRNRSDDAGGAGPAARGGSGGDRGTSDDRKSGRADPQELMMQCAHCGVHVPSSEAVFAGGKVYCSADHRDQAGRSSP